MKLFLLRPKSFAPFYGEWDRSEGFVIRAESESRARQLAAITTADPEGPCKQNYEVWINSKYSTCDLLTCDGDECVIMEDYISG